MRQLFYYKIRQKFITKCVRFFIAKCDSYYKLRVLLQNATVITNCEFYYKMRQLLQNATFITNCDSTTAHSIFCFFLFSNIMTHCKHYLKLFYVTFVFIKEKNNHNKKKGSPNLTEVRCGILN